MSRIPYSSLLFAFSLACSSTSPNPEGPPPNAGNTVELIRAAAVPITGAAHDYDSLLAVIGDARIVLLGESTHGTHEFYRERARITQRLIAEKGFSAVAIEGDWPDAYRANQFVRGIGSDQTPEQALSNFTRFPYWMWRNREIRDLLVWMRQTNVGRPENQRAGFYGLDVYSLFPSIDAVIAWFQQNHPGGVGRIRDLYNCFEQFRSGGATAYGAATSSGTRCEQQATAVLREIEGIATVRPTQPAAAEALFSAVQNARAVVNAEAYFRTAYLGGMSTWNLRDQRMAENLNALEVHLGQSTGRPSKIIVWAHNTHTGDARVTDAGEGGELNVGQLMREKYGAASALVGFLTYEGQVMAAPEWDALGRVRDMRPALPESFAALFHATGIDDFYVILRNAGPLTVALSEPRLQRAIGVIYAPQTERQSHYFNARLGQQFDAAIFFDRTSPVVPLP